MEVAQRDGPLHLVRGDPPNLIGFDATCRHSNAPDG
jgi:hypothetical protein